MAFKGYAAHEQASAGTLMLFKMVLYAAGLGLMVSVLVFFLGINMIDGRFKSLGVPEGAVKTYLWNRYLFNNLPIDFKMEPPDLFKEMFQKNRIGRKQFNRAMESVFDENKKAHLLQSATDDCLRLFFLSIGLFVVIVFFYLFYFSKQSKKLQSEKHVKGAMLLKSDKFIEKLEKKYKHPLSIQIGKFIFPRDKEANHTLIYGASGSGKSTLMNQILALILERKVEHRLNEKTIIYDIKGEYVAKHYDGSRGDIIFFPFDKRSVKWSIFNEVLNTDENGTVFLDYAMLDVVCRILCSPSASKDSKNEYFYKAAGDVLKSIFRVLYKEKKLKNLDLARFLALRREDMERAFTGLPKEEQIALEHLKAPDQASGVLGVLKGNLSFLEYIIGQDGDFCLRKFIEKESQANLFLMNLPRLTEVFRPLMTFAVDLMIRHTLSLPDSKTRRVQFFIDELGSLSKVESIFKFLTLSRSKGGCLYASNQEEGALKEIYGDKLLESFNNNFGSLLVFLQNDRKSAEEMAKQLGEHEVIKRQESRSFSPSSMGDRLQVGDQQKRETLLSYSEMQHLEIFQFFYKLSGVGIAKFMVPPKFYEEKNKHIDEHIFSERGIADSQPKEEPPPNSTSRIVNTVVSSNTPEHTSSNSKDLAGF
jgi:type IV secretory pathway TraG/TraD family ATPase VirD4